MGIFDNATSITIGNKEVKSIKVGEATVYERDDEEEDSTTVTVAVKNASQSPVTNLKVRLFDKTSGRQEYISESDANGLYIFQDVVCKEYKLGAYDGNESVTTYLNGEGTGKSSHEITVSNNSNSWLLVTSH